MAILFSDDGEAHSDGDSLTDGGWIEEYATHAEHEYSDINPYCGSISLRFRNTYAGNVYNYWYHTITNPNRPLSMVAWFYDNGQTTSSMTGLLILTASGPSEHTSIGVSIYRSATHYVGTIGTDWHWFITDKVRSVGWHKFEIEVQTDSIIYKIDSDIVRTETAHLFSAAPDRIYIRCKKNTQNFYFDNILITTPLIVALFPVAKTSGNIVGIESDILSVGEKALVIPLRNDTNNFAVIRTDQVYEVKDTVLIVPIKKNNNNLVIIGIDKPYNPPISDGWTHYHDVTVHNYATGVLIDGICNYWMGASINPPDYCECYALYDLNCYSLYVEGGIEFNGEFRLGRTGGYKEFPKFTKVRVRFKIKSWAEQEVPESDYPYFDILVTDNDGNELLHKNLYRGLSNGWVEDIQEFNIPDGNGPYNLRFVVWVWDAPYTDIPYQYLTTHMKTSFVFRLT